jgi:hypothetical protein
MLDVVNTVENGAAFDFAVTSRPFESILGRRLAVESNFRSSSSSSGLSLGGDRFAGENHHRVLFKKKLMARYSIELRLLLCVRDY